MGQREVDAAAAWLTYADRHWHAYPGRPDAGYFGTGTVAIQSVEAVAEHAFVCAVLGHRLEESPSVGGASTVLPGGLSRGSLIERALQGLRFLTETHRTGGLQCIAGAERQRAAAVAGGIAEGRGGQWGGDGWTPVPAFFLYLVAEALGEALPAAERTAVLRVLADEADANLADKRTTVLEHHGYFREVPPIPTGRFGTSWPESNAWRGALLGAATLALPDHPHAGAWDESMKRHFVNALSVPQDATSEQIVDGRPVRERFVGANVHPHFALEHHGFLHPCYAARTMEFMVLTAWAFHRHGRPVPECTLHHLADEWQMLRRLVLWQGRLAYPAGKDHHRYGWGLTYLLPVLAWLTEQHDVAAGALEGQLADAFLGEQRHNGDGSFVRERMGALLDRRPGPFMRPGDRSRVLYYRAEADPPFYLLLAALIREQVQGSRFEVQRGAAGVHFEPGTLNFEPGTAALLGTFAELDAGLVLQRDAGRFASWSWNAYPDVSQGLFIPRDGDHLAEWNGNLAPAFVVLDAPAGRAVAWRQTATFEGGFATLGIVRHAGGAVLQHVLYAALPDGRSALYADDVRAAWDLMLLYQEGLRFNLGNDLFNGYQRHLRFQGGEAALVAGEAPAPPLSENSSRWLEIDSFPAAGQALLGVQFLDRSAERWTVRTFPSRNATDMSAWYAILCRPLRSRARPLVAGEAMQQTCVRFVANPEIGAADGRGSAPAWVAAATCTWDGAEAGPRVRIAVTGMDGRPYVIDADWVRRRITCGPAEGNANGRA